MKFSQLATLGAAPLLFGSSMSMTLNKRALDSLNQKRDIIGDAVTIVEATAGTLEELAVELSLDYFCLLAANPLKAILLQSETVSIPLSCCGTRCAGPVCSQRKGCNGNNSTTAPVVSSTLSASITNTASPTTTPTTLSTTIATGSSSGSSSSSLSSSFSTTATHSSETSSTTSTSATSQSTTSTSTTSQSTTSTSTTPTSTTPVTTTSPSTTPTSSTPVTTTSPGTTATSTPSTSSTSPTITSTASSVGSTITSIGSVGPTTGDLTVTFTNAQSFAVSISYASNTVSGTPGPPPIGNPAVTGVISASATSVVSFPTGWAGNLNIGRSLNVNNSLFEASFNDPISNPQVAYDISNVNGFSVPMVCECDGQIAIGCNKNLFDLNTCSPSDLSADGFSCGNDDRFVNDGPALPFFAPCQGASFAYPNDNGANANCASHSVTCCIGSECPPNPKQPS